MMTTTTRKERKVVRQRPLSPSTWAELPFDVITEVLLRLPVNSLLRFKSVSKSWRQLITDPYFAKLHHSCSIQSHSKLLLYGENSTFFSADLSKPNKLLETYTVWEFMHCHNCDTCSRKPRLDHGLAYAYRNFFSLVGSSNGLICVFDRGKFALSNPSTRTHRMIPCLDLPLIKLLYIGFGYDPLSYDYKVVTIRCGMSTLQVVVYSLNSNSWREVQVPYTQSMPAMMDHYSSSVDRLVFVNNAMHWLCNSLGSLRDITIICFNIHGETLRDGNNWGSLRLASFEDCLCAINHKPNCVIDIWVMNGYGTWSKSYVIELKRIIGRVVCKFSRHGILHLDGWDEWVQYDTRDKSMHVVTSGMSITQTTIVQIIPIMLSVKNNPASEKSY